MTATTIRRQVMQAGQEGASLEEEELRSQLQQRSGQVLKLSADLEYTQTELQDLQRHCHSLEVCIPLLHNVLLAAFVTSCWKTVHINAGLFRDVQLCCRLCEMGFGSPFQLILQFPTYFAFSPSHGMLLQHKPVGLNCSCPDCCNTR